MDEYKIFKIGDFLEYVLEFWVPRTRYGDKTIRNESTKGSDIIGFKIIDDKNDSPKGESLNAIKQRLYFRNMLKDAERIERFQNIEDRPYKEVNGAAAVLNTDLLDELTISSTKTLVLLPFEINAKAHLGILKLQRKKSKFQLISGARLFIVYFTVFVEAELYKS
ncbi:hypothetical protein KHA94_04500 [Bacillus sp. FJAT-49705]|uniref:Uncharacterized protein n=1 Tax=Cytobacillus citreus TaxID=2833586 RepID=A0ABS5NNV0_9BACI|nr:hypothetical protein [Cytobacillus citreus]MBS4189478.1 hypothetical protein [Cytobacillus citreus]